MAAGGKRASDNVMHAVMVDFRLRMEPNASFGVDLGAFANGAPRRSLVQPRRSPIAGSGVPDSAQAGWRMGRSK
jgi:hypothetical protein